MECRLVGRVLDGIVLKSTGVSDGWSSIPVAANANRCSWSMLCTVDFGRTIDADTLCCHEVQRRSRQGHGVTGGPNEVVANQIGQRITTAMSGAGLIAAGIGTFIASKSGDLERVSICIRLPVLLLGISGLAASIGFGYFAQLALTNALPSIMTLNIKEGDTIAELMFPYKNELQQCLEFQLCFLAFGSFFCLVYFCLVAQF